MKVLLSWSGKQSRQFAEQLGEWLPKVVPHLEPWISTQDINKGRRWFDELVKCLESASACIVCLTPENISSPWLYWETGAIAVRNIDRVFPLLVNLGVDAIKDSPLAQFQCAFANKDDLFHLVRSLNQTQEIPEEQFRLRGLFETNWMTLETAISTVRDMCIPSNIHDLLVGLQSAQLIYSKRLASDCRAESLDPLKQLVTDTNSKIDRLLAASATERRIQYHVQELKNKVGSVLSPNSRTAVHERAEDIPSGFEKAIAAIRADLDNLM